MRALLELSSEGAERGCRVEFIQGPRPVERVFELTGALRAAVVRRRRVAAGCRRHHRLSAAALRNRDFALLFSAARSLTRSPIVAALAAAYLVAGPT